MPRQITALFVTTSLLLMLAMRVSAQTSPCLAEADMRAALARQFKEYPLATALTDQGVVLQVYVGARGSWTMTMAKPGGLSCIVASGHDFNLLHRDGLVPARPV